MLKAYWLFMIAVALLMGYSLARSRKEKDDTTKKNNNPRTRKTGKR